eukprot:COSAG01_NODE_50890_length_359_cov_1.000000_1_plen_119_part_11
MVYRFVDHSAAVTAALRGWKHTPFTPGCALAGTTDVPGGGARGFRLAPPALRAHYHLDLLGDGVVMLCRTCINRVRSVDAPTDHANHARALVSEHATLLPAPAVHGLASYITLQYWLDG